MLAVSVCKSGRNSARNGFHGNMSVEVKNSCAFAVSVCNPGRNLARDTCQVLLNRLCDIFVTRVNMLTDQYLSHTTMETDL